MQDLCVLNAVPQLPRFGHGFDNPFEEIEGGAVSRIPNGMDRQLETCSRHLRQKRFVERILVS